MKAAGTFAGIALMVAGALSLSEGKAQSDILNPETMRHEGWSKTDFSKRAIEWSEITSGGPAKDGIPSIDSPKFVSAADENSVADREAVIGLEVNGEARAYPIRILMWHEIVNDTIGGVPVAVTYCPLCNAAIVFERKTSRGVTTFGTTGKLRRSDLIMYDRASESWWQQFNGKAIVGTLTGESLPIIPARLESFALFKKRHPNGSVLAPDNETMRRYGRNPYQGYDTSKVPFLYRGELRAGINPMARVVVVREGENVFAITLELLSRHRQVTSGNLFITWTSGQASALDQATVAGGRDVGNVVAQRKTKNGEFADVAYDVTFAFVFHAFHPEHEIIQTCPRRDTQLRCGTVTAN